MHICLTCIEFFGDSIYGGFGRATRCIGAELARRGLQVSVVVPRRSPERPDHYVGTPEKGQQRPDPKSANRQGLGGSCAQLYSGQ